MFEEKCECDFAILETDAKIERTRRDAEAARFKKAAGILIA